MSFRFIKTIPFFLLLTCTAGISRAQSADQVFTRMRTKITSVKDYVADVKMKIDVKFMRVPLLTGKLYFKSPGKLKLERHGGISILPKKTISLTLDNLIPGGATTVIDAGAEVIDGHKTRIVKVIPEGESDIVLTKIWIDEARQLALRTETTTKDNGTIRTELEYGKYEALALPDKIVFILDVKEFKLPKGVTMDYDEGQDAAPKSKEPLVIKKGRIIINYISYKINTGLSDAVFIDTKK